LVLITLVGLFLIGGVFDSTVFGKETGPVVDAVTQGWSFGFKDIMSMILAAITIWKFIRAGQYRAALGIVIKQADAVLNKEHKQKIAQNAGALGVAKILHKEVAKLT